MTDSATRQPTEEQRRIIEAPLEPMLVIAGAGSGKTTTMADRVVHLVAQGSARPEEILGVTFTRKAAGELAAKVRLQLGALARTEKLDLDLEPQISTYHSYANGIVGDYGLRLGVEKDAVVLGQAQCWQLASQVVEAYDGDLASFDGASSTLVQAVMALAGECSEHLREPAEAEALLAGLADRFAALPYLEGSAKQSSQEARKLEAMFRTRGRVAELVEHYQAAKKRRNALDYGDLVALAARVAQEMPSAVEQERQKHTVVLLDEFQDTSHAQLSLFAALYGEGHPVTAVGDPHQSIYGFRGASAGQLFRFPQVFRRADGRPAHAAALTVAWRNSLAVLETANVMSAELNRRAAQQHALSSVPLSPLRPRPAAPQGEVELAGFGTEAEEAEAIAEHILERRTAATSESSVAVLCRRRAQFLDLQAALEARGIDVEIVGLGGLLATPEVIDVVATLHVLVDPGRSDALMRLLTGARWRIGPSDLMALADWSKYLAQRHRRGGQTDQVITQDSADSASLVEALDALEPSFWPESARELSETGRSRMLALRDELRVLRALVGEDLLSLIGEVERAMLLDIELAARPGTGYHRARHHLDAFADAAASFVQSAEDVDVLAFLSWLKTAEEEERGLDVQPLDLDPGAVQLLTVHAAKGLEWDEVYVPGLAQGIFPSARVDRWSKRTHSLPWPLRGDVADLPEWNLDGSDQKSWLEAEEIFGDEVRVHSEDEERRLAYVAFTRARNFLMLSTSRWTGTASKPREASPFIREVLEAEFFGERAGKLLSWPSAEELPEENPGLAAKTVAQWPYDPLEGPQISMGEELQRSMTGRRAAAEAAAERVRHALAEPVPDIWDRSTRWGAEARRLLERRKAVKDLLEVQLPEHLSASTLVDLRADPEAVIRQIRRPVPRKPGSAARKGTAFHTWIEQFYGRAGQLDLGEFSGAADDFVEDSYQLAELKQNFEASEWAGRLPAFVEVPIETRVADVVVRGRIDAVFRRGADSEEDAEWDLVDWKTGRVPTAKELEVRAVQLAVYRLAWSRLKQLPLERVHAAFYYVGADRTVRLNELAGEKELESIVTQAYQL
ncbi:DNA helicase-2/ATP-dependent DNA helicase PcrA [Psychromicrobium silvestre]|uniref:DNA 3'-5' helicase n=1 Tax=Psychromicrobium silvestre TaxID=1645614 RepID=A0A7Y9LSX1_9MICC|nr:DNA helicase-2/ATP-dependent DNA helicase PcrA [Psychromicrobium silvestre]